MKQKTNPNSVEIEIQVQVESAKKLRVFLNKNAKFIDTQHQIDEYFTPPDRNFTHVRPVNEWLRLRNSSGKYFINYKNWHREIDGRTHFCDEYESEIESLEQLQNIFKVLNFKSLIVVDKTREIYLFEDYEIALDQVKGLGEFVEIEYKGENHSKKPAEITTEMIKFLKDQACGRIVRNYVGYPYQLLFPDEIDLEDY